MELFPILSAVSTALVAVGGPILGYVIKQRDAEVAELKRIVESLRESQHVSELAAGQRDTRLAVLETRIETLDHVVTRGEFEGAMKELRGDIREIQGIRDAVSGERPLRLALRELGRVAGAEGPEGQMKLTELGPELLVVEPSGRYRLVEALADAHGIWFECPACGGHPAYSSGSATVPCRLASYRRPAGPRQGRASRTSRSRRR